MRFKEFKTEAFGFSDDPSDISASTMSSILGEPDAEQPTGNKPSGTAGAKQPSPNTSADLNAIKNPDFKAKLQLVADKLGIDPSSLITVMKKESNIDPAAVNKKSGATGLIQFMPKTALSLGTTTDALRKMSAVDQLDYVYLYYKKAGVKPGMDAGDLYVATFYPAALGKSKDTVIGRKGSPVYDQNVILDKNRDGYITVADIRTHAGLA